MENHSTSSCLICKAPTSLSSSINSTKQQFHQQLQVIFVLRKILELPVNKLAYHLRNNWDIENWICVCERCDALVAQCRLVYDQLLKISKKFKSCQLDVIKILKESESKSRVADGKNGASTFQCEGKERRKFLEETRCFVTSQSYEHLVDPVERMKALDCRNEVKSETPRENEEDLITGAIIKTELELDNETDSNVDAHSPAETGDPFVTNHDSASDESEEEEAWEPGDNDKDSNGDKSDEENEKVACRSRDSKDKGNILKPDSETSVHVRPLLERVARRDQLTELKVFVCPFCKLYTKEITFETGFFLCNHMNMCRKKWSESKKLGDNQISELICGFCSNYSFPVNNLAGFVNHLVSCTREADSTPPLRYRIFQCNICVDKVNTFLTLDDFIRHYCFHCPLVYKCAECDEVFSIMTKNQLHSHWRGQHTNLLRLLDDTNLPLHVRLEAPRCPSVPSWCPECGESFDGETERDNHYKTRHPSSSFEQVKQEKCQFCDKRYCCSDELKLHQGTVHMLETGNLVQCDRCTEVFVDKSEVSRHCDLHHRLGVFACSLCNEEFVAEHFLQSHHSSVHDQGDDTEKEISIEGRILKCQHCDKKFASKIGFTWHMTAFHIETTEFACELCGKRHHDKTGLRKHRLRVHGLAARRPKKDNYQKQKRLRFLTTSKKKVASRENKDVFPCTLCDEKFYIKKDFKCHQKNAHQKNPMETRRYPPCKICSAIFTMPGERNKHMKEVHEILTKRTKKLKSTSRSQAEPESGCQTEGSVEEPVDNETAVKTFAGIKPKYECEICGKVFGNKIYRDRHVAAHTETKGGDDVAYNSICEACGAAFTTNRGLEQHQSYTLRCKELRMSKEEATVVCHLCGNRYSNRISLSKHVRERHERIFSKNCEHCGRGFDGYNAYQGHLAARHQTGDFYEKKEMFKCTVEGCDKIIFTTRERKRHLLNHNRKLEYKCTECEKVFSSANNRTKHENAVHKGIKYIRKKERDRTRAKVENNSCS